MKKPRFSHHAVDRIKETPMKIAGVKDMFQYTSPYDLSKKIEAWKFQKYGMKQMKVKYHKIVLEAIYTLNRDTDEVITFTLRTKSGGRVFGKDLL